MSSNAPQPIDVEAVDETTTAAKKDAAKTGPRKLTKAEQRAVDAKTRLTSPWASTIAIIIAILWTVPTFGLFVTSFRQPSDIRRTGWWTAATNPDFTFDNYQAAIDAGLGNTFINTLVITIPAVIIPISIALLAAYAFAWIDFPYKNLLFVGVFALQIVPIQVTLIPLLSIFVKTGIAGSFWTLWLSHSIFALPLAIFLLHNFMKDIPASLIEAARVDGAGHVKIFFQVLLPLLVPAIASFAIFQFLWVWNDLLVSLTFASRPDIRPIMPALADLVGSRGSDWYLMSAGAFIAIIIPLIVFFSLQRFFVRGLLAGGVKG